MLTLLLTSENIRKQLRRLNLFFMEVLSPLSYNNVNTLFESENWINVLLTLSFRHVNRNKWILDCL